MTRVVLLLGLGAIWVSSCAPAIRLTAPPSTTARVSLWEEPTDLESRDLYYGPWGPERAPDPAEVYVLVAYKHSGVNPGMTVRDSRGRQWSVKQAPLDGTASEGPIELIVSRVLSAIGYHQPPVYYLPSFTFKRVHARAVLRERSAARGSGAAANQVRGAPDIPRGTHGVRGGAIASGREVRAPLDEGRYG